ncbi:glutathione S-transferase family protein [Leptospira levettii]|uniref:glutathione S-transferase family protein n=1 Tax=Leptospira levettii TaxID=2023178 RepID=UPI0010827B26|nr:glutathione S-transferase family protein [Leptospira levettii]TGM32706.1 glutathione S-transferase family protein [Leptospira levettii]TGM77146.1 glutathione S-transferase family protein [Leptospira levettii]
MDNNSPKNLLLYYHPLASFCHKVLIAMYENGTEFEPRFVDLSEEESRSELFAYWPVGKIPLLRDRMQNQIIPETSVIIEYICEYYPGSANLLPSVPQKAIEVRLWDRFFDLYISDSVQKIVLDRIRLEGQKDPFGVERAYERLSVAYGMLEKQLDAKNYIVSDTFTMADCAAVPALFYADTLLSFQKDYPKLTNYFERLLEKSSVKRTLDEAEPFFYMYPFFDQIPKRFLKEKK